MEASGQPIDADLSGVSLVPEFEGKKRVKRAIYCWYQRDGIRDKASEHVRTDRYKLYGDGRFYDTQSDPQEKRDLTGVLLAEDKLSDERKPFTRLLREELRRHQSLTAESDERLRKRRERF